MAETLMVYNYYSNDSLYLFVIGNRRSLPNARVVIFTPGGAWRRLYSLTSTRCITRSTVLRSKPIARISSKLRSSSAYAFKIGSSTSYGGRLSISFCSGRSSAEGGFAITVCGITGFSHTHSAHTPAFSIHLSRQQTHLPYRHRAYYNRWPSLIYCP